MRGCSKGWRQYEKVAAQAAATCVDIELGLEDDLFGKGWCSCFRKPLYPIKPPGVVANASSSNAACHEPRTMGRDSRWRDRSKVGLTPPPV